MFLALLGVLLLSQNAFSQADSLPVTESNTVSTASWLELSSSFDTTQTALPPKFLGHDPELLYNLVSADSILVKSEFETVPEFLERTKNVPKDETLYAIVFQIGVGYLELRYVPDYRRLQLRATSYLHRVLDLDWGAGMEQFFFVPSPTKRKIEKFVGTNAFGATVDAMTAYGDGYGLVLDNAMNDKTATVSFTMDPAIARDVKTRADRVLLLVRRPQPSELPQALRGTWVVEPTVSSPYGFVLDLRGTLTTLQAMWFFQSETGVVLRKCPYRNQWDE